MTSSAIGQNNFSNLAVVKANIPPGLEHPFISAVLATMHPFSQDDKRNNY